MWRRAICAALFLIVVAASAALIAKVAKASGMASAPQQTAFVAFDVVLDSGAEAMAAYQVEFRGWPGVLLVGIEGGEHRAFEAPPAYDPAALRGGRVVLAAFDTGSDLPSGRTRVARLHLAIENGAAEHGAAVGELSVHTATDANGAEIDVRGSIFRTEGIE